jgi:hypothetical protein
VSLREASAWLALLSGIVGYVLPLVVWARMRPNFPNEVLMVPAAMLLSWLAADYFGIGATRIGFTFLGAIVTAVLSNAVILALIRLKSEIRRHRLLWGVGILVLSVLVGVGVRIFLPALPD